MSINFICKQMNWLSWFLCCFSSHEKKPTKRSSSHGRKGPTPAFEPQKETFLPQHKPAENNINSKATPPPQPKIDNKDGNKEVGNNNIAAQTFTFQELAAATRNFRPDCLIGEGGFGRVYKGKLEKTNQVIAVKQFDRNGLQGNREFLVEVLMLSVLHNQNLVHLIGHCADGEQRLLVYEYMPMGSLEDHLLDLRPHQTPLDWFTRMKIALGASQGLEYLHDKANPPVIHRDLKSSNILLDNDFHAKLSDFRLAKLGPTGDKTRMSSIVVGTYGCCAPEYQKTGQLTVKSDVYSFGVVLLELIAGRRVIDYTRPTREQNLISWAEPIFKDPNRYPELADPNLKGDFPARALNQAVVVAAMCLNEEPSGRPLISDVVTALSFLGTGPETPGTVGPITIPSLPSDQGVDTKGNLNLLDADIVLDREQAVAEATEWDTNSRTNAQTRLEAANSL